MKYVRASNFARLTVIGLNRNAINWNIMSKEKTKILNNETPGENLSVGFEAGVMLPPNTFLNADCMDYLPKCPSGYFDLAIVDPPYGRRNWTQGGTWGKKYGNKISEWDIEPNEDYFKELRRISTNQIIWGANHFGIKTDNFIVWKKLSIGETFSMGMCEFASVSNDGNSKIFEYPPQQSDRFHPTQKPVPLYRWVLKNYAKSGDLILDTHVGSASSLIACKELGFDYVGFEIDKDYYEKASKRVAGAFRKYELNFEQNEAAT